MGPEVFARARPHLVALGEVAGDELDALAAEADRNPPVLRPFDAQGRRVDEVVQPPRLSPDGGDRVRPLRAGRDGAPAGRARLARAARRRS